MATPQIGGASGEPLAEALSGCPVLGDFDRHTLETLAQYMSTARFAPHEVVVAEGAHSRDLYFVLDGEARITHGAVEVAVARLSIQQPRTDPLLAHLRTLWVQRSCSLGFHSELRDAAYRPRLDGGPSHGRGATVAGVPSSPHPATPNSRSNARETTVAHRAEHDMFMSPHGYHDLHRSSSR